MSKYIKNNKKLYSQWNFEKNKDLDPSTLLSVSTASKLTGIHTTSISNACKGNAKTAGGYIWKYAEDNTID